MHLSLLVAALAAALVPGSASESPTWLKDYGAARKVGRAEQKPLCVIIGSGSHGWEEVGQNGGLDRKVKRLLADHYVCLYVDTEHIAGRRLAASFEMDGPGIVISDATGDLQAFRHSGDLPNGRLAGYLQHFADPDLVVDHTETNPETTGGLGNPPVATFIPVSYVPAFAGCST